MFNRLLSPRMLGWKYLVLSIGLAFVGCERDGTPYYVEKTSCARDRDCEANRTCVCGACVVECDTSADCSRKDGWVACQHLANTDLRADCSAERPLPSSKICVEFSWPASPCSTPGDESEYLCPFDRVECPTGSAPVATCTDGIWSHCTCVAMNPAEPDPAWRPDDEGLRRADGLWLQLRSNADWTEFHPTLRELISAADVAVVARLVSVEPGRVIQGDAAEDVLPYIDIRAEIREVLRGTPGDAVMFSFPLLNAVTLEDRDASVARAKAALPIDQVVMLLRGSDAESYRVVNGYGIWARTTRAPIDAPLMYVAPTSGEEPNSYQRELAKLSSLDQLIELFR